MPNLYTLYWETLKTSHNGELVIDIPVARHKAFAREVRRELERDRAYRFGMAQLGSQARVTSHRSGTKLKLHLEIRRLINEQVTGDPSSSPEGRTGYSLCGRYAK